MTFLKNLLFKEIFKGCCLLFSYQGSCRSFLATALIFYQSIFALSRTFYLSFCRTLSSQLNYTITFLYRLSTVFLHFFAFPAFMPVHCDSFRYYPGASHPDLHPASPQKNKNHWFFQQFLDNIKRRRRDLNPRAATNDLLPFQGSPFGQLGYFSIKRRGWDSNPRALSDKRFSRPPRYDHFDTSPSLTFS